MIPTHRSASHEAKRFDPSSPSRARTDSHPSDLSPNSPVHTRISQGDEDSWHPIEVHVALDNTVLGMSFGSGTNAPPFSRRLHQPELTLAMFPSYTTVGTNTDRISTSNAATQTWPGAGSPAWERSPSPFTLGSPNGASNKRSWSRANSTSENADAVQPAPPAIRPPVRPAKSPMAERMAIIRASVPPPQLVAETTWLMRKCQEAGIKRASDFVVVARAWETPTGAYCTSALNRMYGKFLKDPAASAAQGTRPANVPDDIDVSHLKERDAIRSEKNVLAGILRRRPDATVDEIVELSKHSAPWIPEVDVRRWYHLELRPGHYLGHCPAPNPEPAASSLQSPLREAEDQPLDFSAAEPLDD